MAAATSIADTYNSRVLMETLSGGSYTQTTISTSGLESPQGVALDGGGNVYIADTLNDRVVEEDVLTPAMLSFASTPVGSTSSDSPQTVTLENIGNAPLSLLTPSTGVNPSISTGFTLDPATTCPEISSSAAAGTLAAGASCALAVDFIPTVPGLVSGSVTLTDNNLNASPSTTQAIPLSGTGIQISLSPSTLPSGTTGKPYSQIFMAGGGTAPYTYSLSGTLPTGLTFTSGGILSGTPTAAGSYNVTVTATDSSSPDPFIATQPYTLTIEGVPGAPTLGNATAGSAEATVVFTAPASNGDSAITSYTVTSSPRGITSTGTSSPITVLGLTNGVAYTFTVTATNSIGTSPASAASNTVTPEGSQTITFNTIPSHTAGQSFGLTASASSGLAVSFASLTPAVCTVSGTTAKLLTAGACTIQATQAGNAAYTAATPVSQSFNVTAAAQTITFGTISSQTVGHAVSLNASASSGLAVSFASLTSSVCTVSGTTATLLTAGTCTIQAAQAGNTEFTAATPVSQSFTETSAANFTITADPGSETLKVGVLAAFVLDLKSVDGFNGNVALSCSGGPAGSTCADLPMTVRVDGTALAVSGILFPAKTTPGTYTITFKGVSGSLTNTATAQFTVPAETPSLAFAPIAKQTYPATPFAVSATSNSTGAITYSVVSGPAILSGDVVTLTRTGTVTLKASLAATSEYAAATATTSFSVEAAEKTPTLAFKSIPNQTYGAKPFTVSATSNSTGAITYSVASGSATLKGDVVTLNGTGTVTLKASLAATSSYAAATATTSFSVAR